MPTISFQRFPAFVSCVDCQAVFERLIGNLRGFVYRRRHDARWTMEFISEASRDITGYDPHRFIHNESLAFADLIAPGDRLRVNRLVEHAVRSRRRLALEYHIRSAHGLLLRVEDRLAPVFNSAGRLLGIEGVIDRACRSAAAATAAFPEPSDRLAAAHPHPNPEPHAS